MLYPHEGDSVTVLFAIIGGKTCQREAVLEKSVNALAVCNVSSSSAINWDACAGFTFPLDVIEIAISLVNKAI